LAEVSQEVESGAAGHGDIKDDEVRSEFTDRAEGFEGEFGLADDQDPRLVSEEGG